MYGIDDMFKTGLYNLFINGLDVQSIHVHPHDMHGMHKLFVTGLKRLYINVSPCDVKESANVRPDSDLTGMDGIGMESSQNGLNGLNGLGPNQSRNSNYCYINPDIRFNFVSSVNRYFMFLRRAVSYSCG